MGMNQALAGKGDEEMTLQGEEEEAGAVAGPRAVAVRLLRAGRVAQTSTSSLCCTRRIWILRYVLLKQGTGSWLKLLVLLRPAIPLFVGSVQVTCLVMLRWGCRVGELRSCNCITGSEACCRLAVC